MYLCRIQQRTLQPTAQLTRLWSNSHHHHHHQLSSTCYHAYHQQFPHHNYHHHWHNKFRLIDDGCTSTYTMPSSSLPLSNHHHPHYSHPTSPCQRQAHYSTTTITAQQQEQEQQELLSPSPISSSSSSLDSTVPPPTTTIVEQAPPPLVTDTTNASQSSQSQSQSSSSSSSAPPPIKKKKRRLVPLREPFKLTPTAAQRVLHLLSHQQGAIGLKVSMNRRGCNGLTTVLDYVYGDNIPRGHEEVTDSSGVKIYVEPTALMYVIGTVMDYVDDEVRSEFVFHNPNAQSSCGCGESVSVPDRVAKTNQKAIEMFKTGGSSGSTNSSSSAPAS